MLQITMINTWLNLARRSSAAGGVLVGLCLGAMIAYMCISRQDFNSKDQDGHPGHPDDFSRIFMHKLSAGVNANPVTDFKPASSVWDTQLVDNVCAEKCLDGQNITNMPPICGTADCLQNLEVPHSLPTFTTEDKLNFVKKSIANIEGWCHEDHVMLIHYLSLMQWSHGVYGLVGEIGVFRGKFASVLAQYTDTENGERFFVCDIFNNTGSTHLFYNYRGDISMKIFFQNMRKVGFTVDNLDLKKQLYVWYGSSNHLSKQVLLQMNLPSARIMSIDGCHDSVCAYNDLNQVACIMHQGGIIIIDDVFNINWSGVAAGIKLFNEATGDDILKPLIHHKNKLYLTTADWYHRYMKFITETDEIHRILIEDFLLSKIPLTADLGFLETDFYMNKSLMENLLVNYSKIITF